MRKHVHGEPLLVEIVDTDGAGPVAAQSDLYARVLPLGMAATIGLTVRCWHHHGQWIAILFA